MLFVYMFVWRLQQRSLGLNNIFNKKNIEKRNLKLHTFARVPLTVIFSLLLCSCCVNYTRGVHQQTLLGRLHDAFYSVLHGIRKLQFFVLTALFLFVLVFFSMKWRIFFAINPFNVKRKVPLMRTMKSIAIDFYICPFFIVTKL